MTAPAIAPDVRRSLAELLDAIADFGRELLQSDGASAQCAAKEAEQASLEAPQ